MFLNLEFFALIDYFSKAVSYAYVTLEMSLITSVAAALAIKV